MKLTLVNFILDQSGSMGSIRAATIKGVNEYIESLRKTKGKVLFSLTLFRGTVLGKNAITTLYEYTPIKKVKPLTSHQYKPDGSTPLYDAVCESIEKTQVYSTKCDEPAILNVVMTDGEENSSREHNAKCLKDIIADCQDQGNWTFVFLGANQDSWANASQLGYQAGNTANWDGTTRGVGLAFSALSANSVAYCAQVSAGGGGGGKGLSVSNFNSLAKDKVVK